jgi:hypothetical protein
MEKLATCDNHLLVEEEADVLRQFRPDYKSDWERDAEDESE